MTRGIGMYSRDEKNRTRKLKKLKAYYIRWVVKVKFKVTYNKDPT